MTAPTLPPHRERGLRRAGWRRGKSSSLERFGRWLRAASGDEDVDHEARLQALREGHAVIAVATPDDAAVQRAHEVLLARHAHSIRAFETWTVANLPTTHPIDPSQP